MTTEINATASLPAPAALRDLREPDAKAQSIVDELVCFWPNDGTPVSLRRIPTQNERHYLRMRQRDLHNMLRPLSIEERKHAAKVLAAMFIGFPNMRSSDNAGVVAAYIMALEQYPLFAISEACDDVMKRRVSDINPDFAPTAPRLCDLATRHLVPLRSELVLIEKTLAGRHEANPITSEERERIKIGLEALADAMKVQERKEREARITHQAVVVQEATIKIILDEYRRLGIEPVYADSEKTILLSPALAKPA